MHWSGDQGPVHKWDSKLGAEAVLEARDNSQVIPSVEEAAKGKAQVGSYGGQEPQAPAFQSSSQYRPTQLAWT